MIDLKDILAIEKPPEKDKKKIKDERRARAIKKFISLTDKERGKLFGLIQDKFNLYELHMGAHKLYKKDFVYSSHTFLKSYLFDLAMDISDSIKQDWNRHEMSDSSAVKEIPVKQNKEVINEAKLVERRFNDS